MIRKPRREKVLSGDLASKNLKHILSLNNNIVTKHSSYITTIIYKIPAILEVTFL